jgi:hypothetical protein
MNEHEQNPRESLELKELWELLEESLTEWEAFQLRQHVARSLRKLKRKLN